MRTAAGCHAHSSGRCRCDDQGPLAVNWQALADGFSLTIAQGSALALATSREGRQIERGASDVASRDESGQLFGRHGSEVGGVDGIRAAGMSPDHTRLHDIESRKNERAVQVQRLARDSGRISLLCVWVHVRRDSVSSSNAASIRIKAIEAKVRMSTALTRSHASHTERKSSGRRSVGGMKRRWDRGRNVVQNMECLFWIDRASGCRRRRLRENSINALDQHSPRDSCSLSLDLSSFSTICALCREKRLVVRYLLCLYL